MKKNRIIKDVVNDYRDKMERLNYERIHFIYSANDTDISI